MSAEKIALFVGLVVFAGGAVGLLLQRVLPEHFTTGGPRDMIGAVSGLLTLLLALVLGLLIWTAYGVYSGQNIAVQTLAARLLQLDLALTQYGSEADAGRAQLRQDLAKTLDQIWNANAESADFAEKNFSAAIANLEHKEGVLETLSPSTDAQKQALAAAAQTVDAIGQARLQMSFALLSPISYPLLFTVIGWAVILFCAYGLMSKTSPMSYIVLFFGALAIATGVYLIIDLSFPYSGVFRASPAPLQQVLAHISQNQGAVGGSR